jgi:hypothetical protein
MSPRLSIVYDPLEDVAARFVDFKAAIWIVVAQIRAKCETKDRRSGGTEIGNVKGSQHATFHTRIAQEMMGGWVHNLAVVPTLAYFSADTLRGLYADAEGFLGVRKVGVIEDAQEDDRRVFLAHIDLEIGSDPRGNEE